jgi:hypothetical protein
VSIRTRIENLERRPPAVCRSGADPRLIADPLEFGKALWPDVKFYGKQLEIIESVRDNDETIVHAANQVGKDFVAGFLCVWFICTKWPTARVVTTSVRDDHLRVLWAEILRFVNTAAVPLRREQGGPLIVHHRDIRRVQAGGAVADDVSYLIGTVSLRGEGLQGHHAEHTFLVCDEASGLDDQVYTFGSTWSKRALIFGNPNPTRNFFFRAVKAGDLVAPNS